MITSGDNAKMTMTKGNRSIVFKKLEKNLYYLEGKPGGNHAIEVNATEWEDLTDDDMPGLISRVFESSDDDSDDDPSMPSLVDRDHGSSSSESSDDDSDFSASDLPDGFGGNIFTSIFLDDGKQPSLPTNRSWTEAVLNKNSMCLLMPL